MKKLIVLSLLCLLTLPVASAKAEQAASIEFDGAWTRETAPNPKVGAAYGVLKNSSDTDVVIKSLKSDVAGKVELHEMAMDKDVMVMRKLEKPVIPAGGELVLEPAGKHIMMMGMKQQLKADTTINIQVEFEDGSSMISEVKVNPIGWTKD